MTEMTARRPAKAMWSLGGLTWWQLLRRVWRRIWADQLPGRCAELAYYFLFSVFPLLVFLTALLGHLAGPNSRLRVILFHWLARVAPSPEVSALLTTTLDQVSHGGGARLSLSLLVAVWAASSGMLAVARTLNAACAAEETRPWWSRRLSAMGLTVGFAVLIICALAVMFYGHQIGEELADQLGLGPAFVTVWHVLRWTLVLGFALLSFDAVYNYAPCLPAAAERHWGTPGAVVGVGLWLAVSFGFRIYLLAVHSYATTYGSLAAVIVLLLWFYLTAFAILAGGEVNSEIARQGPAVRQRRQRRAASGAPPARGRRRSARA
jgi:membrane protein